MDNEILNVKNTIDCVSDNANEKEDLPKGQK